MKLIRYHNSPVLTPAANFFGLRNEMDRLFDIAFSSPRSAIRNPEMPLDLYETENAFILRAELPGFRKEDLNVEVADGELTIHAHQKSAEPAKEGQAERPLATERRISRTVPLPEKAKADGITAEYENGVLAVTLPREEDIKPRRVAINVK